MMTSETPTGKGGAATSMTGERSRTLGVVPGHALDDPMPPWNNEATPPTPESVLNHHALGYTYDNELVSPPRVVLTVDAPPLSASIGRAGEVDYFSFVVSSSGPTQWLRRALRMS